MPLPSSGDERLKILAIAQLIDHSSLCLHVQCILPVFLGTHMAIFLEELQSYRIRDPLYSSRTSS